MAIVKERNTRPGYMNVSFEHYIVFMQQSCLTRPRAHTDMVCRLTSERRLGMALARSVQTQRGKTSWRTYFWKDFRFGCCYATNMPERTVRQGELKDKIRPRTGRQMVDL